MKNGGRVSAEDSTTFSVTKEDVIEICNSFPSAVVTPTRREPKEKVLVALVDAFHLFGFIDW